MAIVNPPKVILMDVRMPVVDGIQATKAIKERRTEITVVGLTSYDTSQYLNGMIHAGASGFLLKDSSAERFISAIRAAALGNVVFTHPLVQDTSEPDSDLMFVSPDAGTHSHAELKDANSHDTTIDDLSAREQQILHEITQGKTNAAIGQQLGISESTVKGHVRNILAKLHMQDRTEIIIWAYRNGIAS